MSVEHNSLKGRVVRQALTPFYKDRLIKKALLSLFFQVISAQQLPKPEWDKPSSIVDPQVWVEIHGVPIDNNKKKTHHIENNGKYIPS